MCNKNTIGIFCAGQAGDCATISSILYYRKELWGEDCKIIWYISNENMDLLKFQDIEVKEFPRGFGYPEMVEEENEKLISEGKEPTWEDWQPLMDENNHLNLELAKSYPSMDGITHGYFPAPHQMSSLQRHGISYPECSKKVFDVPMDWEWHPVLKFSEEEINKADEFIFGIKDKHKLGLDPYRIAIESMAGSGQSLIEDEQIKKVMEICNEVLGSGCHFIFMSHKYLRGQEEFPHDFISNENVHFAKTFTVRQCALIVEECDLLISVSSGISVASVCWGSFPVPILQFCGSEICSTSKLSEGRRFELVTHDDKILDDAYNEMNLKLNELLNEIK